MINLGARTKLAAWMYSVYPFHLFIHLGTCSWSAKKQGNAGGGWNKSGIISNGLQPSYTNS